MYAIAKRFSLAARRAAANASYENYHETVDADWYCPLGRCLKVDYPHSYASTPTCVTVATKLVDAFSGPIPHGLYNAIVREADRFIEAWDNNCIPDLHRALGVK